MLPDIGASELMVIALVALIFVGPKDLPMMLKKLGQFTSKMRRMAADFRTSFDDMARQSELEDLRREVEQMRAGATQAISDPVGINATLRETIDDVDSSMIADHSLDYEFGDYTPAVPVAEEVAPTPPAPKKPAARKAATKAVSKSDAAPKARKPKAAPAKPAAEAMPSPRRRAAKVVS